jgi:hypothetical protein
MWILNIPTQLWWPIDKQDMLSYEAQLRRAIHKQDMLSRSLALTSEILFLFSVFLFVLLLLKYHPGRLFTGIYLWILICFLCWTIQYHIILETSIEIHKVQYRTFCTDIASKNEQNNYPRIKHHEHKLSKIAER